MANVAQPKYGTDKIGDITTVTAGTGAAVLTFEDLSTAAGQLVVDAGGLVRFLPTSTANQDKARDLGLAVERTEPSRDS